MTTTWRQWIEGVRVHIEPVDGWPSRELVRARAERDGCGGISAPVPVGRELDAVAEALQLLLRTGPGRACRRPDLTEREGTP